MRILYVTLISVLLDQITKLAVRGLHIPSLNINWKGMFYGESIPVFGDFFRLTYVENPGMAFSIEVAPLAKLFVSLFSILASIALVYYLYQVRKQRFSFRLSLALILGGAIGNLIDRVFYGVFFGYGKLFYGRVVDFMDFNFFDIDVLGRTYDRFPIFNIADMSVSIGVMLLIIFYRQHQQDLQQEEIALTDSSLPFMEAETASGADADDEFTPSQAITMVSGPESEKTGDAPETMKPVSRFPGPDNASNEELLGKARALTGERQKAGIFVIPTEGKSDGNNNGESLPV